jgi:hypothetical protein
MNAQQLENQEIWKQIKGAEKLFENYGYYPTLHDAKIEKIEVNYEKREFYLTVNYSDLTEKEDKSFRTRFTICWRNVQTADFNWYGEDLYSMKFSRENNFIKTKFTDFSFGFDGEIISGDIEIRNIEIDPEKEDEKNQGIVKFSLK